MSVTDQSDTILDKPRYVISIPRKPEHMSSSTHDEDYFLYLPKSACDIALANPLEMS